MYIVYFFSFILFKISHILHNNQTNMEFECQLPSDSDFEDEDFDDDLNIYEFNELFKLNKQRRSIKVSHKRLNWNEHVLRCMITGRFQTFYHMTLPSFNRLVELLRPQITIDVRQSRISTRNNDPIYPEMVVGAGLRYLGGLYAKDMEHVFGISEWSARQIFIDILWLSIPAWNFN